MTEREKGERERARPPRAQSGAMARTDYSTRGNKDALSIQGTLLGRKKRFALEVGGQLLEKTSSYEVCNSTCQAARQVRQLN